MFGFEQGFREMPHNIIDKKALAQAFSDYLSKGGHSQQVIALLNRNIPLLKGPHFLSCTTVFKCIVYLKNSKNEPIIGYILDNKANKTAEKRLFFVTTKYEQLATDEKGNSEEPLKLLKLLNIQDLGLTGIDTQALMLRIYQKGIQLRCGIYKKSITFAIDDELRLTRIPFEVSMDSSEFYRPLDCFCQWEIKKKGQSGSRNHLFIDMFIH